MKIQKRENFSLLFVQRVDKVLNFLYNKGGKDRKLHKLCRRYAVCFRYFCDVSYPQLRELKLEEQTEQESTVDVSYPQLRELKQSSVPAESFTCICILPAAAGIETKQRVTMRPLVICILPAAAGIETMCQQQF